MVDLGPLLGEIEDVCPSCRVPLVKRPQRKTLCKACGEFIYSKRRPQDREVVLVDEADRAALEEQWNAQYRMQEAQRKADFETRLPIALAMERWQDYSGCIHGLAIFADQEGDWVKAFELMSKSMYLTITGLTDRGYWLNSTIRRPLEFPVAVICDSAEFLGYDAGRTRDEFLHIAKEVRRILPNFDSTELEQLKDVLSPTPVVSPEEAWEILSSAIDALNQQREEFDP